jgi:hypothetical protein
MSLPANSSTQADTTLSTAPFRYAVIDLASATEIRPLIARLRPSAAEPLFARTFAQELLDVGPWVVRLSKAPEVESMLANMSFDIPWGYYVHTTVDIISLRQSLRRFNLARIPDSSKAVLFRYWDPRVMRVFLDVASREQRKRLFEWIDRIEAADGSFDFVSRS